MSPDDLLCVQFASCAQWVIRKDGMVPLRYLLLLSTLKRNNFLTALEPSEKDVDVITLFQKNQRNLLKLNVIIFRGFQNVLALFLFIMKHSWQLIIKSIPGINNWGYFIKGWGHFINTWFIWGINTTLDRRIIRIFLGQGSFLAIRTLS